MIKPWSSKKNSDVLHSLCSYLGTFPPSLAKYWIEYLTDKGDIIFDPFSGRGTVILEGRLCERRVIASDLNPIAIALSEAKSHNIEQDTVLQRIKELKDGYDPIIFYNDAAGQEERIHLIFNPRTLAELCYLRRRLVKSQSKVDKFLVGIILGILHGSERKDGSSGYASISMPNTFSMSPEYVRKFVQTNVLSRAYRDVFKIIEDKVKKIFEKHESPKIEGTVLLQDAKSLTQNPQLAEYIGKVKLILTSPPYLGVVNYAKQNWIRTWFLDRNEDDISKDLDDDLNHLEWLEFSKKVIKETKKFLAKDGVAIFVIGDVAKSQHSVIPIARDFINHIRSNQIFKNVWVVNDGIDDLEKTTRIWGDTKGNATTMDRIVILSDINPFESNNRLNGHSMLDYEMIERDTKSFIGY